MCSEQVWPPAMKTVSRANATSQESSEASSNLVAVVITLSVVAMIAFQVLIRQ